jgi:hypothetical protein
MESNRKVIKLILSIGLFLIGAMTATTSLVFMAHGHHWDNSSDELIFTPLIVLGIAGAVICFIWGICVTDELGGTS